MNLLVQLVVQVVHLREEESVVISVAPSSISSLVASRKTGVESLFVSSCLLFVVSMIVIKLSEWRDSLLEI